MKVKLAIALPLLLLTLVACSSATEPPPKASTDAPGDAVPTESSLGESPLSPPATPTRAPLEQTSPLPTPAPTRTEAPSADADQVMASTREYLATELEVQTDAVHPVSIQAVEWPDAALGCPSPGESYAQVITPGYRVVLEVDGLEYELHTDRSGSTLRVCEQKGEGQTPAAVAYLAERLDIAEDEITVISVAAYEWPDASLGCPQPGRAYAQVVTPGYRIILEAQGDTYEVRTDEEGTTIILCEEDAETTGQQSGSFWQRL